MVDRTFVIVFLCFMSLQVSCGYRSSGEYHRRLSRFMTTGLTDIIWQTNGNISSHPLSSLSPECMRSIDLVRLHIHRGSQFAFEMLDASSKSPSGFLKGTISSFGDYDECLDISQNEFEPKFLGKHCMVELDIETVPFTESVINTYIRQNIPIIDMLKPNFGLCIPSTCASSDVKLLVNHRKSSHLLL